MTSERLTDAEKLSIRSLHRKVVEVDCNDLSLAGCEFCEQDWPCETIRLLDECDEQAKRVNKLEEGLEEAARHIRCVERMIEGEDG
jgi:hypothetical protein